MAGGAGGNAGDLLMARGSRVDFSMGGAARHAARLGAAQKRARAVADRAVSTLVRRLKPEAARLVAGRVLNLSARAVSQNLNVARRKAQDGDYVTVSATKTRLPLIAFTPRFSKREGVTVTTWRDKGPQQLPHAFRRRDKPGVWQRVPYSGSKWQPREGGRVQFQSRGGTDSGLVDRLPIVQRKGPSMHRVFEYAGRYAGHGDIRPQLSSFVQSTLTTEIARLIRAR